jgi:hypothetical protein
MTVDAVPEERPEALAKAPLAFLRRESHKRNGAMNILRGVMTERTSLETDIRPLFIQRDIRAMSKAFNLASLMTRQGAFGGGLRRNSSHRRRGHAATAPRREGPWPQSRIDLLGKWIVDGCPP